MRMITDNDRERNAKVVSKTPISLKLVLVSELGQSVLILLVDGAAGSRFFHRFASKSSGGLMAPPGGLFGRL